MIILRKGNLKFLVMLLLITFAVLGFNLNTVSAKTYKDLNYTVMKNGKIRLNAYTGKKKTLTIPKKIKGKKVTTISKKIKLKR